MNQYAVLMAGGAGRRLWPLSRIKKPKQFISVDGRECMMLQTIDRIRRIIPSANCFVITSRNLRTATRKTLKGIIPESNILAEPEQKNTAACIAYATFFLRKQVGEDAVACFFPADGYVKDRAAYRLTVARACETAENTDGLVIIGIAPSYPSTGYGYIHVDRREEVCPVSSFTEKPDRATAEKFLASGHYLWNSGIVAGKLSAFSSHIQKSLPEHYERLSGLAEDSDGQDIFPVVKKAYAEIPSISFDKGVLERSGDIVAVRGTFDWDDIGNLESLAVSLAPDADGNKVKGHFLGMDTKNCIVYAEKTLVTAVGMENVVIAVTEDAVLICPRDRVQDVGKLAEQLKDSRYSRFI